MWWRWPGWSWRQRPRHVVQTRLDDAVEVGGRAERLRHHLAERVPLHSEQLHVRARLERRRPRRVAQDRDLAEEVARPERERRLRATLLEPVDLALDDDDELVRRPAGAHDR